MNNHYITCDLGSSQCKTGLFDEQGSVVALVSKEYRSFYPNPGWVEQNPQDWVDACFMSIVELLRTGGVEPSSVKGIGIVGVTHNSVLLDEQGRPLGPTILLYDTRSLGQVASLKSKWGRAYVRERTLNDMTTVWSWPQLQWIMENRRDIWDRVATIVFQKDYVRSQFVDEICTDHIDAGGSLLYDPMHDCWIPEFCDDLGLRQDQLPKICDPMEIAGGLGRSAAVRTGLLEGTPVIVGTTDTAAEVLAAGALEIGMTTLKLASVGRVTHINDQPIKKAHVLNYRHLCKDLWYPGTASKSAAYSFRWLKDLLYPGNDQTDIYQRMDALAAESPAGSDGLLFHPHLMGEWAPHWDVTMKGNFIGLQARHSQGNLIRAVLEGVAFSLLDAFNELEIPAARITKLLLIGQGSRSPLWSRIIANVFGQKITVPTYMEAVHGAGILTIMAVSGKKLEDFRSMLMQGVEYQPDEAGLRYYEKMFPLYREADAALRGIYTKLDCMKGDAL